MRSPRCRGDLKTRGTGWSVMAVCKFAQQILASQVHLQTPSGSVQSWQHSSECMCMCVSCHQHLPAQWAWVLNGLVGREEEEADIWLELAEPGDVCGAWGSCTVTLWIPAGKRHSTGIGAELLLHMKPRTDGSFQLQTDSNSQNWIVCYLFFLTSVKVTTITGKHYPSSRYFSSTLPARTICNHNLYDRALPCQLSPKKDALVTRAT